MVAELNVRANHYDELKYYKEVKEILASRIDLRLPTAAEAIYLCYEYQAIWVSDVIGNKHCVMDQHWGIQVIRDGCYGLILLEKENE